MNLETLKSRHQSYLNAAKSHREIALANDGAAQAVAALISEEEKALACADAEKTQPEAPADQPPPENP